MKLYLKMKNYVNAKRTKDGMSLIVTTAGMSCAKTIQDKIQKLMQQEDINNKGEVK